MFAIYQDNTCHRTLLGINAATFTVCELLDGAYIAPAGYPVGNVLPIMKGATINEARDLCNELNNIEQNQNGLVL